MTLGQFSVSACANQSTGLSVNESSTLSGLFQTINELIEMAPLTITWCIVPLKNRKT